METLEKIDIDKAGAPLYPKMGKRLKNGVISHNVPHSMVRKGFIHESPQNGVKFARLIIYASNIGQVPGFHR